MPANSLNSSDLSANSRRRLLNLISSSNKNATSQKETLILEHFEKDNLNLKRVSSQNSFDWMPSFSSSSAALSTILSETSLNSKSSVKETFFDKIIKEDINSKESKEDLFSHEFEANNLNYPLLQLNDSNQSGEARKEIEDNNINQFLKSVNSFKYNDMLPSVCSSSPSISISETSFIEKDSSILKSKFQFHDCDFLHKEANSLTDIKINNVIPLSDKSKIENVDDDNLFSDSSNESIESDLDLISAQLINGDFEKLTPCQKHKKFKNLLRNYEILKKKCEYSKLNMHRNKQRKKNIKKKSSKIINLVKKISCLSI